MSERRGKMKNIKYNYMIGAVTLLVAVTAVFLPGYILKRQSVTGEDVVVKVPQSYEEDASSEAKRTASDHLEVEEKLSIIQGEEKSIIQKVDAGELRKKSFEVVQQVKKQLQKLSEENSIPKELISSYGNWYHWEANAYQAEDAAFHRYSVYFWRITFTKYDGTQTYEVQTLEDGTVFLVVDKQGRRYNLFTWGR